MLKSVIYFVCLLFSTLLSGIFIVAFAQSITDTINGIVIDRDTEKPLEQVRVSVSSTEIGAVSDSLGRFTVRNIPIGTRELTFSRIGYQTDSRVISIPNRSELIVGLIPTILNLDKNVVVTATRTPESVYKIPALVTILDNITIQEKNIRQTPELLREAVGVTVQKTNQGGGSPIIRGLKANKLLFMVDGIRMNNATYRGGNFQYLNTIDSQGLERVEVVHGPNSVMYGSDALGGVINAISRKPDIGIEDGISRNFALSSQVSSADRTRTTDLRLSVAHRWWGIRLSGAYKSFGDVTRGGNGGGELMNRLQNDSRTSRILTKTQRPNGYDAFDLNGQFRLKVSELREVVATYQGSRQNDVPRYDVVETLSDSLRSFDPQTRHLAYIRYIDNRRTNWYNNLSVSLSWHRQFERRFRFRFGNPSATVDQFGTNSYGAQVHFNKFIRDSHHLVYGADVYYDAVDASSYDENLASGTRITRTPLFPDESSFVAGGFFLQDDWQILPVWSITPGLRVSLSSLNAPFKNDPSSPINFGTIRQRTTAITGSIGSRYLVNDQMSLVTNIGQGFRTPNLDDSSKLGPGKGATIFEIPNQSLTPERSISFDGGIKIHGDIIQSNIIGFYNQIQDLLIRRPTTLNGSGFIVDGNDTLQVFRKENAGQAFTTGFAVNSQIRVNEALSVFGNISYTYGRNVTDDEPLTGIAPINGLAGFRWNNTNSRIELNMRFAREQTRLSSEDQLDLRIPEGGTPAWYTLNLRTGLTVREGLDVQFSIGNILDQNYREHLSGLNAPGRNFILGLSATY